MSPEIAPSPYNPRHYPRIFVPDRYGCDFHFAVISGGNWYLPCSSKVFPHGGSVLGRNEMHSVFRIDPGSQFDAWLQRIGGGGEL